MGEIKIIQYNHSYAKSLSEMWLKSAESWGGGSSAISVEDIIEEHENTSNLNDFLAVDGDEVVGCCNFGEYTKDTGALYIPTLNVRPDYHGKGIGKKLILKVLERTFKLGWARLDLYTWPGNTKAVPLYKKCGFFWEKREDTTHLMNFIPTVFMIEAVKDYFKYFDWYKDSKRSIVVEPDGIEENGFNYYEYIWEKKEKKLRIQFEKTGRGLRLIETNDYLIKATVEDHSLVFGKNYKIIYEVINKTQNPIEVSIKGSDNRNIKFSLNKDIKVIGKQIIEGEFYVGEIEEEQNKSKNHPTVTTNISINGKSALFKIGIFTNSPGKILLTVPDRACLLNKEEEMFIDIENNFNQKTRFKFVLNSTEKIRFIKEQFEIELDKKERKSISAKYILKEHHVFTEKVSIDVRLDNGESIKFKEELSSILKGYSGVFWGETDKNWYLVNGKVCVAFDKSDNSINPKNLINDNFKTNIMYPQIGKPYSEEFSKLKYEKVDCFIDRDAAVMTIIYKPSKVKDIEFASIVKLYGNGIMEYYNEIKNISKENYINELWIKQRIYNDLFNVIIPYNNKYIHIKDFAKCDYENLEANKLTENWIFSKGYKLSRGLCWNKDYNMNFLYWHGFISINIGSLFVNETKKTESLYVAIGTFDNWKEFRRFSLNIDEDKEIMLNEEFEIRVNNNNPFVRKEFKIDFIEYKNISFEGTVELSGRNNNIEEKNIYFKDKEKVKTSSLKTIGDFDVLKIKVDFDLEQYLKEKAIFKVSDTKIQKDIITEEGLKVFKVNNGIITMKASPEFSSSLFSLIYKDIEWLDNSFPTPIPKSWFNPWAGGIGIKPVDISDNSVINEEITCEFVNKKDNKGNLWEGIKTNLKINKDKRYKGLEINQYYLMLPGVSVMCYVSEIIQNTGRFINSVRFDNDTFINVDDEITKGWVLAKNEKGEEKKIKCGKIQLQIKSNSTLVFGSINRKSKLNICTNIEEVTTEAFINNKVSVFSTIHNLKLKNEDSLFIPPVFYILSEEDISHEQLKDLNNIRFI